MEAIQIALDADLVKLLEDVGRPAKESVPELIVLELYREGLVSSGRAAELLHVTREAFIRRSGEMGVPYFRITPDELREEVEKAKARAR